MASYTNIHEVKFSAIMSDYRIQLYQFLNEKTVSATMRSI